MSGRGRGRSRGRSRGRGAYFAAKYGNASEEQGSTFDYTTGDTVIPQVNGDFNDLASFLKSIDKTSYPNYKPMRGGWQLSPNLLLIFDQIQGDAYAAPSRARLRVPLEAANFPPDMYHTSTRATAFCDYLTRKFSHFAHVSRLDFKRKAKGWASAKGGDVSIDAPGQHVLSRTSCIIDGDTIELRITAALPARGRTIEGFVAAEALTQILPGVAEKVMFADAADAEELRIHVQCVADQEELRESLIKEVLVAFVADGAILPRAAGDSDKPMDSDIAVPFKSPESLATTVSLSSGLKLRGMGIKPGISLIVGGGFHGKSTLLAALQVGVYNHVPGDGREFVCVLPSAMSIRAEDGRFVVGVDISPFISNLPFQRSTNAFCTMDASGSTSQAANIIEALDAGSKLLLTDEDLSATNFMMRDARMQQLVPPQKEPITPMIQRIRALLTQEGVSSILVVGGAGDYFEVSDTVVMMDTYVPLDVTGRAKQIAIDAPSGLELDATSPDMFKSARRRKISSLSLRNVLSSGRGKVFTKIREAIDVGAVRIELSAVAGITELSQTKAIAAALERLAEMPELELEGVAASVTKLMKDVDEKGLDVINCRGERMGNYARPRSFEVHAALNRLRGLEIAQNT